MDNVCSWYDPSCSLQWMSEELQSLFTWLWDSILSACASVLEALPVPDFLLNTGSFIIPGEVSWAASAFNIEFGIGIIVSAYVARFVLRRIPLVG